MRVLFFTNLVNHFGFEPLGIMYLSAALRQVSHETRLIMDPGDMAHVRRQLAEFQPQVLAFSITTGVHERFIELNRTIKKEYSALSIFGGPHATFFPEIIEEEAIDCVCRGEGERALVELCDALRAGRAWSSIDNLWVKRADGEIVRNSVGPLVRDLDALPFADRDLLAESKWPTSHGIATVMAGRGCPYSCTYCFNHAYKKLYHAEKNMVRHRSVANVIEEVQRLRERLPVQFVFFVDDCLILDRNWLRELCAAWAREVRLPFMCNGRFNLLDDEAVALLKKAGCATVIASVEAGNDHLRNSVLKRRMTREQIVEGAGRVRQARMALLTQAIIGLPFSDLAAEFETLDLVAACRPASATATLFQPYPGTELGEATRAAGLCGPDWDRIPESYRDQCVLQLPDREMRERLQAIFPLAAESRLVRRLMPLLLRIPAQRVYRALSRLWTGYCSCFRLYPSIRYPFRTLVANIFRYLSRKGG